MQRSAFLVVGAESTGTRLVTRILITAGCAGSDGHDQPFDARDGLPRSGNLVWRRSVPHRGAMLDLKAMRKRLQGFSVHVVVVIRDWTITARSQLQRGHETVPQVFPGKLQLAYGAIFEQIMAEDLPFTLVVYESLVLHPGQAQRALKQSLGLEAPKTFITVSDENRKHWETP